MVKSKDEEVLYSSSSGGAGYEISKMLCTKDMMWLDVYMIKRKENQFIKWF